jgi:peptidoglycan lytic transglycosylase
MAIEACGGRARRRAIKGGHAQRWTLLALLALVAACTAAPPPPVPLPTPAPPPAVPPPKPAEQPYFSQSGLASIYALNQQGHRTASGESLNNRALTAAHRKLPFYTVARVTVLGTGKMVKVRINDRGPFVSGRIVDLSQAAAGALGILNDGTAPVRIEVYASDQP